MRILYIDCTAGVAGDMMLGALLDAGANREYVDRQLKALGLDGWELDFHETKRAGLRALHARVTTSAEPARSFQQVRTIISRAALDEQVTLRALEAFHLLAQAEAQVHGSQMESVHFHEVGSTDAVIDIVGTSAALADINPDEIVVSPIAIGSGFAKTAHGSLPIPAPATVEILRRAEAPVLGGGSGELATPTGAALIASIADSFGDLPAMTIESIGIGAGRTDRDVPNVVRTLTGEAATKEDTDLSVVLETNLDDMAPELFPYVIERLMDAGAQDVWITPIVMKKGRPAFTLSALVTPALIETATAIFFAETTTLGVRAVPAERSVLHREWIVVQVAGQPVQVKIATQGKKVVNVAPENDDAVAAARATGLPLKEVYERASSAARQQLGAPN